MEQQKPRIRMNVKTTAKGECQLDVTIETFDLSEDPLVRANRVATQLNDLRDHLRKAGFEIAGEVSK